MTRMEFCGLLKAAAPVKPMDKYIDNDEEPDDVVGVTEWVQLGGCY